MHPLAQTLATDGGTFTLSFWFDLGPSQGDEELGFSGLEVQWGNQIALNVSEEEKPDQGYRLATIPGLKGDPNGVWLQFFAFNTTDDGAVGIDNVSVIETDPPPAPTAGAPEPGTALLCLGGPAAAVVLRKRQAPCESFHSTGA